MSMFCLKKLLQNTEKPFGRIAVLYGGNNSERYISLQSSIMVMKSLQAAGVDAVGLDVTNNKTFITRLLNEKIDRAFIIVHGRGGEDGCIQGLLECMKIPYTGSGVLASAITMNKLRTKQMFIYCGILTPKYVVLNNQKDCETANKDLNYPLIVKPVHEGSSIGITKVINLEELIYAWKLALFYDNQVLVEEFINGVELSIVMLREQILPIIQLHPSNVFFDYNAKYFSNKTTYKIPCSLSKEKESDLKQKSKFILNLLEIQGVCRLDVIQDPHGKFWFLEANTVPGMTEKSLVLIAANYIGLDTKKLVLAILADSLESKK